MHSRHWLFLLLALLLVTACSSDERPATPQRTQLDYELFETTKQLDDDALDALDAVAADRTQLSFSRSTSLTDDLKIDDVLLSGQSPKTPEGLLVQVTSVERSGDGVVVRTRPATVFHAFRRLDVHLNGIELGGDAKPVEGVPASPPEGGTAASQQALKLNIPPLGDPDFDEAVFDGDKLPTLEDRVNAKGKMVEQVSVTFWLSFDWEDLSPQEAFTALENLLDSLKKLFSGKPPDLGDILHLDTGLRIDGDAEVMLGVVGASSLEFSKSFNLSTFVLPPIFIGPLAFVPTVTLDSHFDGGVAGSLDLAFGLEAGFGLGFGYEEGDLTPYVSGPTLTTVTPTTTASASARLKAELELRLNLQMYGFFGPYAGLIAYAEVDVDRFRSPCWKLSAGLDGSVGASIGLFGKTLKHIQGPRISLSDPVDVASGSCLPLPNPPATDKLITPWSRSFGGTHWSGGTDESFTNLELSHDGRLLVSSSGSKSVMKVATNGALTWARTFEEPSRAVPALEPEIALPTLDAGILVGTREHVLVKLDQGGALEWATQLQSANTIPGWGKGKRRGDEIWLAGSYSAEKTANTGDAWLVGLSPDGGVRWAWTWGTPEERESVREILPLADGALVLGVARNFKAGSQRGFLLRLNADGTVRWAKYVDDCAAEDLVLSSAILSDDGNLIVGGWLYATHTDALLFRVSPDATETEPAWATRTGSDIVGPMIQSIHQLPTGELRVVGRYAEFGNDRVFVGATDSIGRFAWLRRYGSDDSRATPPASLITPQGGLLVASSSASLEAYPGGTWLFEVPVPNGMVDFAPGSATTTDTLSATSSAACLTLTDAPTQTSPVVVEQRLTQVRAEDVPLASHVQCGAP